MDKQMIELLMIVARHDHKVLARLTCSIGPNRGHVVNHNEEKENGTNERSGNHQGQRGQGGDA